MTDPEDVLEEAADDASLNEPVAERSATGGYQGDPLSAEEAGQVMSGETTPTEEPSTLEKLFTQPAKTAPRDLVDHELVELLREGFGTVFKNPREALGYLARSVISVLDALGLPVGGEKNMPPGVHLLIALVAVPVAFLRDAAGDDDTSSSTPDTPAGPAGADVDWVSEDEEPG